MCFVFMKMNVRESIKTFKSITSYLLMLKYWNKNSIVQSKSKCFEYVDGIFHLLSEYISIASTHFQE